MQQIDALYAANERWKDEIIEETKRHFDIAAENLMHDMRGVNHDEIEAIKDRVAKLEKVVLK